MRYIRVRVPLSLLVDGGSTTQYVDVVVDTDSVAVVVPTAIARAESGSVDTIVDALNASVSEV